MTRTWKVLRRTAIAFYDDQMTHHAAALTYYALMSLFPALLLGASLLGLLGQNSTYDDVVAYLRGVVPDSTLEAVDDTLRTAQRERGTAATTLAVSVVITLYGTTGVLEAARRALNVVFDVERGRRFFKRKAVDIASSFGLMGLVLAALTLVFVGERLAGELLGPGVGDVWGVVRWPAAFLVTVFLFSSVYYVTPDVHQRSFRWVTPGAVVGVTAWLAISWVFGRYIDSATGVAVLYGAFASAIVLIAWLWMTNVALLFGAELDAEIEREKEIVEGVPPEATLARPAKG